MVSERTPGNQGTGKLGSRETHLLIGVVLVGRGGAAWAWAPMRGGIRIQLATEQQLSAITAAISYSNKSGMHSQIAAASKTPRSALSPSL